jgi:hypothetical protein
MLPLLGLHFYPEDGGSTLLWNTEFLSDYTASHPSRKLYRMNLASIKKFGFKFHKNLLTPITKSTY